MLCKDCSDYVDNICQKAQVGKLSQMEGDCLLRCGVELLRDIWEELATQNNSLDEGDNWKIDGN